MGGGADLGRDDGDTGGGAAGGRAEVARRPGVWGPATTVLGVLVVLQGFHSLEHVVQWVQYHVLYQPPSQSSGLISAANAEWVHFVWNWIVVTLLVGLARGGVRNRWSWLLLAWAGAHAAEHTYMMVRYLQMKQELAGLGVPSISAQGLPGFFGRDGWLARGPVTQNTFLCRMPVATTTSRLDVHFWWNTGEILLLAAAAHVHLRRQFRSG
ncbi:MAG: hypothetical protein WKH64_00605 [Chloroflexia bacterium]